jgi:hypothetical protein
MSEVTGYNIRFGTFKKEGFYFHIFLNSCLSILNLGTARMITINEMQFDPGPNIHKNVGNNNAAIIDKLQQSVIANVKDKCDTCGEFYATHLIPHLTNHELGDEEKDAVDLPSNFTKRNMYKQYCCEQGWLSKLDNKIRYPKLCDYERRKKYDLL